ATIVRAQTHLFNQNRNQPKSMPPDHHAQTSRGAGSFFGQNKSLASGLLCDDLYALTPAKTPFANASWRKLGPTHLANCGRSPIQSAN
ncbi:hypothetical protein, partial [Aquidulcibacter sp.]|uniref:hypothetical protein n=1 Tax=Aquidulcibacter sp. TaxID=2052990 RepID=UPI0037C16728